MFDIFDDESDEDYFLPDTLPKDTSPIILKQAMMEGNLKLLKQLISDVDAPIIKTSNKNTLLHIAVIRNQSKILEYLLSLSTDYTFVNYHNKNHKTALSLAVKYNHPCLIKKLLEKNADINVSNVMGETPLHLSVEHDNPDIIRLLIENGANLDAVDSYERTALHNAAQYPNIAKLLIENGADPNIGKLKWKITALHLAVTCPQTAHVLIKNGANLDARDFWGRTPLYEAVHQSNLETVCMLLYYNANPNIGDYDKRTSFMKAIITRNIEIQNVLLHYVTDFNATDKSLEITTLGLALQYSSPHVQEIVNRGADVNYQHKENNSYLMCLQGSKNVQDFRSFWSQFNFQPLRNGLPYLEAMIYYLNEPLLVQVLRIIIDNGNVSPIFQYSNFTCVYYKELQSKWERVQKMNPKLCSELICSYLCEGKGLHSDLVCEIYRIFGYCELLRICVHMDIEKNACKNINMGILFYDPLWTVNKMKEIIFRCDALVDFRSFLPYLRVATCCNISAKEDSNSLRQKLQGISSLKELARNSARDYLVSRFSLSTSKEYNLFIQNLTYLCIDCKDILTFKTPLYDM